MDIPLHSPKEWALYIVGTSIEPPYNLHMAMDSSWNGPRGAPALRQVQTPQGGRSKSLWRARESGMMIVY